jgi:hypothetical protein
MRALLDWWDGVELWLTQLSFPLQVLLAILVLIPACWLASALIDRIVDAVLGIVSSRWAERTPSDPKV